MTPRTRSITVDYLARVEGEGGLAISLKNGAVSSVKLNIFEPPRFFEAFLRGRAYDEAPDITARICGICPVAYQMSAVSAMEDAFHLEPSPGIRALRRLLYCGEWIESHALHVFMLHAPDFLGYQDAIRMAADHADLVKGALRAKKLGNEVMRVVGGREVHPINVRVGGSTGRRRAPRSRVSSASSSGTRDFMRQAVTLTAALPCPQFEQDYEFVALRHPERYAIEEGRLVSNRGLDIAVRDYLQWFTEEHVQHSNALHSTIKGRGAYHVGPLARYALNFDRLPAHLQALAGRPGLARSASTPSRASSSGVSRPCTRAKKRCGSSPTTRRPTHRRCPCSHGRRRATAAPRRRAESFTIATGSTTLV